MRWTTFEHCKDKLSSLSLKENAKTATCLLLRRLLVVVLLLIIIVSIWYLGIKTAAYVLQLLCLLLLRHRQKSILVEWRCDWTRRCSFQTIASKTMRTHTTQLSEVPLAQCFRLRLCRGLFLDLRRGLISSLGLGL